MNTGRLDGNAIRTQRTRARILDASLALFNELGEPRVTTGMVAESLGMSPGNLYYHFHNKDEIVAELFRRFEERVDLEPGPQGDAAAAIEDLWLYLHLMLEAIWEYRFLHRNLDDLLGRNRRLRERFNRIVDRKARAVVALCEALVRARAMKAGPGDIAALAANVLVVSIYWLNFQSARRAAQEDPGGAPGQGAYQVMALFAPYLRGGARRHLDRLGRRYID